MAQKAKHSNPKKITQQILTWYAHHGRHDLPWRQRIAPYTVWLSEIMLQQTQVTTVVPYFQRFLLRFPTAQTLAAAHEDEVLHLWSGLGYYARARNLHKTAKIICSDYAGDFPDSLESLQQLPGIGRTTAGAILAIAFNKQAPILDGNVKRLLTRLFAIEGWPGKSSIARQLWDLAEALTPEKQAHDYTQAVMDMGATICTRTKPKCTLCPLQQECLAHQQGNEIGYPQPKPRKALPCKRVNLLILNNHAGEILLEKRPPVGIWGGLYSLPECPHDTDIKIWCAKNYGCKAEIIDTFDQFRHTFSHFHLDITPVQLAIKKWLPQVNEADNIIWYNRRTPGKQGLPAPIMKILAGVE